MIITRTPYRLSLFGGGTDFPAWYERNGGAVLAGAIDKYCYLTLRDLPPFFEHRYRIVYSQVENTKSHQEIRHPAVRAAFDHFGLTGGMELHHDWDLPARSGIGSSAAFSVGLVHAIRALQAQPTDAWTLAHDAMHLEQELLQEVGGSQDQVTCALGGFNHLKFLPTGEINASSSHVLANGAKEFNAWLVLLYTGVARSSSEVSSGLTESLRDDTSQELKRMREMVEEGVVLLTQADEAAFRQLGALLHENWRLKGALNRYAVTQELAELYDTAIRAGAIGGKISGAGGGGFLLFCVPPDRQPSFVREMSDHCVHVPFSFVDHGSQILFKE